MNLVCGNSAIVIQPDGIKLISPGDAKALTASFNVIGPSNFQASVPELPAGASCEEQL